MFIKNPLFLILVLSFMFGSINSFAGKKKDKKSNASSYHASSVDRNIDALMNEFQDFLDNRPEDNAEFQIAVQAFQAKIMQGINNLKNPKKMLQAMKQLQNMRDQASQRRDTHRASAVLTGARQTSYKESKHLVNLKVHRARAELAKLTLSAAEKRLDIINRKIDLNNRKLALAEKKAENENDELSDLESQKKVLVAKVETAKKDLAEARKKLTRIEVKHGESAHKASDDNDVDDERGAVSTSDTRQLQGRFHDVLNSSYITNAYQKIINSGHVNFDAELTAEMLCAAYQEYSRGAIEVCRNYKAENERRNPTTTSNSTNLDDTELNALSDEDLTQRLASAKINMLSVLSSTQSVMKGKAEGLKKVFQNPAELFTFIKKHVSDVVQTISVVRKDNTSTTNLIKELESLAMVGVSEKLGQDDSAQTLKRKIENALFALRFKFEKIELSFAVIKAAYPFICLIDHTGKADVKALLSPFKNEIEKLEGTYILYNNNIEELYERYKKLLEMTDNLAEALGKDKDEYQDFMFALHKERKENKEHLLEKSRTWFALEQNDITKLISDVTAESKRLQKERAHQKMVNLIKVDQQRKKAQKKAEEEAECKREEEAERRSRNMRSASAFAARECATDVDHYRQRYFEQVASARAESLILLEEMQARAKRKAERKATKNHEATLLDDTTTSSSDNSDEGMNLTKDLPSKHYRLFQDILEDKYREFKMQEVASVVIALGGVADYTCAGSRVRLELPYLGAKEHSAVRVIHSHLTYGHKGLEGGRMKSVREMLAQAGYTTDNVIPSQAADSDDDGVSTTADGNAFLSPSLSTTTRRHADDNDDDDDM